MRLVKFEYDSRVLNSERSEDCIDFTIMFYVFCDHFFQ